MPNDTYDRKAIIEEAGQDFQGFLRENDFRNCNALIDSLREQGLSGAADQLRKEMTNYQFTHSV